MSEVSVTDCDRHIIIHMYVQKLGDLGVKISCLAFRLGNNTEYFSTQGMSQCNQFSEEDHSTHTPKEYTVQKFKKYGTLHPHVGYVQCKQCGFGRE